MRSQLAEQALRFRTFWLATRTSGRAAGALHFVSLSRRPFQISDITVQQQLWVSSATHINSYSPGCCNGCARNQNLSSQHTAAVSNRLPRSNLSATNADAIVQHRSSFVLVLCMRFPLCCRLSDALNELLPEAFATVREASRRVLGMRHFDSQLVGEL
jgi:hypothetical protein